MRFYKKYLKYKSKYLNLQKNLKGGTLTLEELKKLYPANIELVKIIYTEYIDINLTDIYDDDDDKSPPITDDELKSIIDIYIAYPDLQIYISQTPNLIKLQFISDNIEDINILGLQSYPIHLINSELIDLYKTNPNLRKYIKYMQNIDTLRLILSNIQIVDILIDYYPINLINNELIDTYKTHPELQKYIKYKPEIHKLHLVLSRNPIVNLLLEHYTIISLDNELLEFYTKHPKLQHFIKYILDKTQLPLLLLGIQNFSPETYYNRTDITDHYNVGIEVEGCSNNETDTLTRFECSTDISVNCPPGLNLYQREFILKGFINKNNLPELATEITAISNILSDSKSRLICSKSCGIHFHISNEYILFNLYGLLFLANLIILWLERYQGIFIKEFPYQIKVSNIEGSTDSIDPSLKDIVIDRKKSYSKLNDFTDISRINGIVQQIIQHITDKKFNDFHLLFDIFKQIQSNHNKYNLLNVYEDYKYIHIEFRGLATVYEFINIGDFIRYVNAITDLYAEAIRISIGQIPI